MALPTRSIPLYSLYGENKAIEDIEFVHAEDIVSRSKLYNWEISPHTHSGLFQIMVIVRGGARMVLDEENKAVSGPCLVLLPAGTVHGFQFDPDTEGKIISVAVDFLEHNSRPLDRKLMNDVLHQGAVLPYHQSAKHFTTIKNLADQIHAEFRHPQLGRAIIFDSLLRALLVHVSRHTRLKELGQSRHGHQTMFNRYRAIIEKHFKRRWTVADYANDMNITESKLNRICQSFAQKSAFEVLQDRILLEAQRYLIYTSAPLAEIAYDLGFNDSAYFCRYFKKRTGLTPKAFRNQRDKQVEPVTPCKPNSKRAVG